MKKIYMILAAIAAMTLTVQAQTAGTINVGEFDNAATTYDGSFFDMAPTNFYLAHTGAQMIYTPDLLTDMDGKQNVKITGLKFKFYNEGAFEEIYRDVKIYLEETDATEFAVIKGVKQFFTFSNPIAETSVEYDMLSFYGEDQVVEFELPQPFAFTPGKSLLITIVFDAQDDDNCTVGSAYAPFYTSEIRGRAMTYTDNWTSFVDFAQGEDFPDATSMLGCGTNVDLPVTQIAYTYEEGTTPVIPTVKTGAPTFHGYTEDGIHAYFVEIIPTEPSVIYYRVQYPDGNWTEWAEYEEILSFEGDGKYRIEAYAVAEGKLASEQIAYEFVVAPRTGIDEMSADKQIAGIRYFNMAGQEMQQAEGLTIVVTTYTDGTTSAVKVVK